MGENHSSLRNLRGNRGNGGSNINIEDILAPWEYNPASAPKLCEVHHLSILLDGKQRLVVAALIEIWGFCRYLVFRLDGDDATWTLGRANVIGTETFILQFAPSISNVELRINAAIQSGFIYRQFTVTFNEGPRSDWTASLAASGDAHWTRCVDGRLASGHTRFCIPVENFLNSKAKTWRDKLAAELENPHSDAIFARQIFLQGNSRRQVQRFGLKSEDFKKSVGQLRLLWKLVLSSHYEECAEHLAHSNGLLTLGVRGRAEEDVVRGLTIWVSFENRNLQIWAELFIEYGPVQFDLDVFNRYAALRDIFQSEGFWLRIFVEPSAYHERLEAKLQLLEWAKTHVPPEKYAEIEALETHHFIESVETRLNLTRA